MVSGVIRYGFVLLYSLYTFLTLNAKLIEPIVPKGKVYIYIYILALLLLLLLYSYKPFVIRTAESPFCILLLFTGYIILFGTIAFIEGAESTLWDELLAYARFIAVTSITVFFVKYFELFSALMFASFAGGSLLLIYEFFLAGCPLEIFKHMGTFFSNTYILRYRVDFNFNNFNTVGNIAVCLIIVFFMYIAWIRTYEKITFGYMIVICICAIAVTIDSIVLLSSGSRNAMMTLMVFIASILYFYSVESKCIARRQRILLKLIFIGLSVAILFIAFEPMLEMFKTSGRMKGLKANIPIIMNKQRIFEGLGLMSPGVFGREGTGAILDNYYLYVFIETGIIGVTLITILFAVFSMRIHRARLRNGHFFRLMSASYTAWLVSGVGETCVLYPSFTSSLIFLVIFLSLADIKDCVS